MASEIVEVIKYVETLQNPIAAIVGGAIIVFLLYQRFFGSEYSKRKDYYDSLERSLKSKTEECERLNKKIDEYQQKLEEHAREIEELSKNDE